LRFNFRIFKIYIW